MLTEKKAITDKRHLDKLDKIKIQPYKMPRDPADSQPTGPQIRAAAVAAGQSVQAYILQAIKTRMQKEGLQTGAAGQSSSTTEDTPAPTQDKP